MKIRSIRAALLSGAALVMTWGLADVSAQVPSTAPVQPGGQPKVLPVQPIQPGVQPGNPGIQPGGPNLQPGGGRIGLTPPANLAKPVMTFLDVNKDGKVSKEEFMAAVEKFFKDCDKGNTGKIDEKAIAEELNKLFPQVKVGPRPPVIKPVNPGVQPGGPAIQPVPVPNPGVQPGGQAVPPQIQPGVRPQPTIVRIGQGNMMARAIVKRTGTDKENKVTLERFKVAADRLFRECDKDNNGSLDEKEIAFGIEQLMIPAPIGGNPVVNPGFGPAPPPGVPVPPAPPGRGAPQPIPPNGVPQPVPPGGAVPLPGAAPGR
jgi:Ca2+-binding EF-hand superfamily protein